MPDNSPADRRVLLLAPTTRDGEATRSLLAAAGIECVVCASMDAMCARALEGASALIVPEEVVLSDEADRLAALLKEQPVWSDIPVVVLSRAGAESMAVEKAMATLGNVSLIERPMRVSTLLSVVRAALRARDRQYQIRDHLLERGRIAEERAHLLEAERTARSEAERASHMKDEFLATLSHELRTPLNAILGWSQILVGDSSNASDVSEGLRTIERNARAQTQIIEDLLDMSRIVSGKVRLELQRIDLASVVHAAVDTVKPSAEVKDIRLTAVLDPRAEPIAADPNRLQQVFWNLLTNAIKFTPRGGQVQVALRRVNSRVEVCVSDTGVGIKPEFLPHVFDRFRQADATTTRQHGGLGLGLSIVKQLVELHGGTVSASSNGLGKGCTFTVTLPVTPVTADSNVAIEGKPAPRPRPAALDALSGPALDSCKSLAGVRVLVVDDEVDARSLVKRVLEDCEAVVRTAGSAAEAIALLDAEAPDVLVTDIGMPGEDGYALIKKVRSKAPDRGGNVPAVALTAYARSEDRMRSVLAGFQMHIAKPVTPAELITMIASLAGRTG